MGYGEVDTMDRTGPRPPPAKEPEPFVNPKAQREAELYAALARAILRAAAVPKDSRNEYMRYDYASAETVFGAARIALASEGLSVIPVCSKLDMLEQQRVLRRWFWLSHSSGAVVPIESPPWPVIVDKGRPLDKALAAADTSSLRWLVRDLLLLPQVEAGEDVDARDDSRAAPAKPKPREAMKPQAVQQVPEHAAKARAAAKEAVADFGRERVTALWRQSGMEHSETREHAEAFATLLEREHQLKAQVDEAFAPAPDTPVAAPAGLEVMSG